MIVVFGTTPDYAVITDASSTGRAGIIPKLNTVGSEKEGIAQWVVRPTSKSEMTMVAGSNPAESTFEKM